MKDEETNLYELKEKIRKFCEDRDWDQFHNIKDLAVALSIETSELLELFRWKNPQQVEEILKNRKEDIKDELADVLYFLLRIAQMNNIDLSDALDKKMEKNEKRYPLDKFKGSNRKYNEL